MNIWEESKIIFLNVLLLFREFWMKKQKKNSKLEREQGHTENYTHEPKFSEAPNYNEYQTIASHLIKARTKAQRISKYRETKV